MSETTTGTARARACAHCGHDLTGASRHIINRIDVCADIHACLARTRERREESERRISELTGELAEAHQLIDEMIADQHSRPRALMYGVRALSIDGKVSGVCGRCGSSYLAPGVAYVDLHGHLVCTSCANKAVLPQRLTIRRHTLRWDTEIEDTRAWLHSLGEDYEMTATGYPEPKASVYIDGHWLLDAQPNQTLVYDPEHGLSIEGTTTDIPITETESTP